MLADSLNSVADLGKILGATEERAKWVTEVCQLIRESDSAEDRHLLYSLLSRLGYGEFADAASPGRKASSAASGQRI
jgi:restriction endonuclease Mrr